MFITHVYSHFYFYYWIFRSNKMSYKRCYKYTKRGSLEAKPRVSVWRQKKKRFRICDQYNQVKIHQFLKNLELENNPFFH